MLSENFSLEDSESEMELNTFMDNLLGIEKFSPDSGRLEKHFRVFKNLFTQENIPIVIVAGTNGKGEVSLILERYCYDNGLYPMLWNSPHILSVRERMSFGGLAIGAQELLLLFEQYRELVTQLSYYEFLFFCFCAHAQKQLLTGKIDKPILILEVGLGGRLDATNYFDADLALLTSISRDHVEFLGTKLSDILQEKIAVSRPHKILITALEQSHLRSSVDDYCCANDIRLLDLWGDKICSEMDFHQRNQICAEAAMGILTREVLNSNDAVKINSIDHVWGRPLKMTYRGTQFILLGSHNLDGLRHMAQWIYSQNGKLSNPSIKKNLQGSYYFDEAWFGFSRQNQDELKQCLGLINASACIAKKVILTSFEHYRATSWEILADCAKSVMEDNIGKKVYLEEDFSTLIRQLDSENGLFVGKKVERRILLAGSYYFLGRFVSFLSADSYQFS